MKAVRRLGPGVLVAGLVSLGVLGAPSPAGADDELALELYDEALAILTEELGYLQLLGRIEEPVPFEVEILPEAIGLRPLSESAMQAEIELLDQLDGPDVLEALLAHGENLSPEAREVLSTNVPATGPVDAGPYLDAYDELLDEWWVLGGSELGPDDFADPREEGKSAEPPAAEPAVDTAEGGTPNTAAPGVNPPATATPEPAAAAGGADADDPSSGPPLALIGGGLAIVLAAAGAFFARRKKPSDPSQPVAGSPVGRDEVLEASRRLLAANTFDELGAVAVDRARALSGATGSLFVHEAHRFDSGVVPTVPDDTISQVHRTGRTVVANDYMIVPIVAAGRVAGHVAVNSPTSGPEAIEELAPLIGEGLANVTRNAETEAMAFVDGMTGVPNRRRFDLDLAHAARDAASSARPVAVAMFDVDHFKTYNDTNGHQLGDEALQLVARLISQNVREGDTVYRYGGEEFVALLPATDTFSAEGVVERVRQAVEAAEFPGGSTQPGGRVTLSVGVATTPPDDGHAMVRAADAALYTAKEQGRNRVVVAPVPGSELSDV